MKVGDPGAIKKKTLKSGGGQRLDFPNFWEELIDSLDQCVSTGGSQPDSGSWSCFDWVVASN